MYQDTHSSKPAASWSHILFEPYYFLLKIIKIFPPIYGTVFTEFTKTASRVTAWSYKRMYSDPHVDSDFLGLFQPQLCILSLDFLIALSDLRVKRVALETFEESKSRFISLILKCWYHPISPYHREDVLQERLIF